MIVEYGDETLQMYDRLILDNQQPVRILAQLA